MMIPLEESLLKTHQEFYDALFLEAFKALDIKEISEEKVKLQPKKNQVLLSA